VGLSRKVKRFIRSLLLLGGLFVLISIACVVWLVGDYSQLQRYQAGHCTITAKQLLQEQGEDNTVYRPDFQFTVQANDGSRYPAQGYDTQGDTFSDRTSQQAIVDQYAVGETYPCWYDPANPTQAVLTLQFNWGYFLIPVLFLFTGGLLLYGALKSYLLLKPFRYE
jgi:hypothetical protein